MDEYQLLERIEKLAILLGEERALRAAAERKVESAGFQARFIDEMLFAMQSGRKIDAIKLHRQMTGAGLKESKDAIERVTNLFASDA